MTEAQEQELSEEEKARRERRIKRVQRTIEEMRRRVDGPQLVERVEVFSAQRFLVNVATNFLEAYIAQVVWNVTLRKIVPTLPALRYRDVLAIRAFLVGAYPRPRNPRLWDPTRNKII